MRVSETLNKLCPVKGSTCDLVMDQLDLIGRFGGSRLPRPVRAWSLACWVWTVRARPPPLKWCRASWHPRRERCASLEAWLRLFYGVSWCFMLVSRVFQPMAATVQRFWAYGTCGWKKDLQNWTKFIQIGWLQKGRYWDVLSQDADSTFGGHMLASASGSLTLRDGDGKRERERQRRTETDDICG